eukprot:symbB.v1.2.013666.t2/scaffold973.1/size147933/11
MEEQQNAESGAAGADAAVEAEEAEANGEAEAGIEWYYQEPTTGQPAGPWTVAQLRARWQRDEINGLTPVWHVGRESWTPIAELPELKEWQKRRPYLVCLRVHENGAMAHGMQPRHGRSEVRHHKAPERIGYAGERPDAATQLRQMQAELDDARRQLAEEQQVSQKLREQLSTQRAEYTREINSLQRAKDQLSNEMLELIQDLEGTLTAPEGNATIKRVLSEGSLETTPVIGLKADKSERCLA